MPPAPMGAMTSYGPRRVPASRNRVQGVGTRRSSSVNQLATTRNSGSVILNRTVNTVSLEVSSVGTKSYGIHWHDIEGLELKKAGARKGG